ncbi:adenylylsulfatase HINT3 isoform X1 [Salvia hispanica]|uniref:adenylylsulfatase HINT3 isoform X1 n=1 Tax=Salvia hispanica TaxID=49212 RepID=UPI002009CA50|nr:adenylylsulfatase HINT3 isoform X1 [Salvia hispanica]XP_047955454.1 adenylylsulfatase HINT3 isoform X1 [Salvia hispanica]
MEARARRRLALLSSHVNPLVETSGTASFSSLMASACNGGNEMKKGEDDCVFCRIVLGEAPALKLYEDDECVCILDTYPLCHGHSLIIPKGHYPSLDATPPSIIGAMCSKVPLISNAVMKVTGCDSFNLLVNNGAAAGQVIYHTHIHIIPRKANDCLWTSESLRRRPMKVDQEVSQLADRIRESLMFVSRYEDSKGQGSSLVVN